MARTCESQMLVKRSIYAHTPLPIGRNLNKEFTRFRHKLHDPNSDMQCEHCTHVESYNNFTSGLQVCAVPDTGS